ncbi:hypothetical protein Tcan_14899 [Toxocara canis]|uniref:Uncharacterized protein n=1 Tax=Toxocara canis TaxID=6265 RepID=A0A0B2V0Y2_TOXCA|nr:hypothetical protein Tcan_14899 [Toxocara canis]
MKRTGGENSVNFGIIQHGERSTVTMKETRLSKKVLSEIKKVHNNAKCDVNAKERPYVSSGNDFNRCLSLEQEKFKFRNNRQLIGCMSTNRVTVKEIQRFIVQLTSEIRHRYQLMLVV